MADLEIDHMTYGNRDGEGIDCPWCGKRNVYVTREDVAKINRPLFFENNCFVCSKPIIFTAELVLKTRAVRKGDRGPYNGVYNDRFL